MTSPAQKEPLGAAKKPDYSRRQRVGFYLALPVFVTVLMLFRPEGLSPAAQKTFAVAFLMAFLWITEAIPIAATALLPLALFPFLRIMSYREVAPNYGDNIIFLFMGGFFLAMTMQKWDLHRRLSLRVVNLIGTSPKKLVLGFMLATAFMSMMISNTSSTMLMYPIALAVILQLGELSDGGDPSPAREEQNFRVCLMLAIAYAASVGGIGTLIGTPPNAIFAGMVGTLYPNAPEIEFSQWLLVGIPLVLVFLPIIWFVLTYLIYPVSSREIPGARAYIGEQVAALGKMTKGERLTLIVFLATALGLIFRKNIDLEFAVIPGWANVLGVDRWVSDTTVVMLAAFLLFVVPVNWKKKEFLLDWPTALKIPWGILLLFGGGIALAKAFQTTGLAEWVGSNLTGLGRLPLPIVILSICLLMTFLTELTSNLAMTTLFMPILAATAIGMNTHPFLLMIPATMSASCAFMLPVATPPNAIIFGSGHVTMSQMAKAGLVMNLIGAVLVTLIVYVVAIPIFKMASSGLPAWAH